MPILALFMFKIKKFVTIKTAASWKLSFKLGLPDDAGLVVLLPDALRLTQYQNPFGCPSSKFWDCQFYPKRVIQKVELVLFA